MTQNEEAIFGGTARIAIHFKNKLMWQKYRKYVLKTGWDFDDGAYPSTAYFEHDFHGTDDILEICKQIVFLLQLGFDVRGSQWTLTESYRRKMMENSEDETSIREFMDLWDGYQFFGRQAIKEGDAVVHDDP